jgi:hypothetical protein
VVSDVNIVEDKNSKHYLIFKGELVHGGVMTDDYHQEEHHQELSTMTTCPLGERAIRKDIHLFTFTKFYLTRIP